MNKPAPFRPNRSKGETSGTYIDIDNSTITTGNPSSGTYSVTSTGVLTLTQVSGNVHTGAVSADGNILVAANLMGGRHRAAADVRRLPAIFAHNHPLQGFLDPSLYGNNVTPNHGTGFHDITSGKSGSYSAVVGYDLVTGWGSPKGGLIDVPAL